MARIYVVLHDTINAAVKLPCSKTCEIPRSSHYKKNLKILEIVISPSDLVIQIVQHERVSPLFLLTKKIKYYIQLEKFILKVALAIIDR